MKTQRHTEDRVKEIDLPLCTDTLHFYHSEGDRQHLVWQGWSSLVCSWVLTATWRGWTGQLSQPRHVLLLKKWYIYQPCNHFSNDQGLQFFFLMCTIAVFHKINWPYIFLYFRMIFIKKNEWKLKMQIHKNSLDSWVSSLYRRILLKCKETAGNCVLVMQGDVPMEMSILIAY